MDYIVGCMCDLCENGTTDFCKVMLKPIIRLDNFGNNICECGGFIEKDKE